MAKRLISIIAIISIIASTMILLPGCSKEESYTIGVSIYQYSDNFMALYRDQLLKKFEEQGAKDGINYNIVMTNGNNDPNDQANQIDTFIAMKVDLIILNPVLTSSCNAILEKIERAGIPCVIINREPLGKDGDESYDKITQNSKVVYVGCKALQSGEIQGELVYELDNHGDINGDGTLDYLLLKGDPENPDAQLRTLYSIGSCEKGNYNQENARYQALCEENNVNIEAHAVMDDQLANWDQAKAEELTTNALSITNNKIEVIFCNNDAMALGALTAVKKKNLIPGEDVYIVGVDGLDSVVKRVNKGAILGTVQNDANAQSQKALDISIHFLKGGTKANFPHEDGKSEESEARGYYWIDYVKVCSEK